MSARSAAVFFKQAAFVVETVSTNTYLVSAMSLTNAGFSSVLQPSALMLYFVSQSWRWNTVLSVLTACSHSYPYCVGTKMSAYAVSPST